MIDINKPSKELNEEEGKKVIVGICLRNILRLAEPDEKSIFIYIIMHINNIISMDREKYIR